MPTVTLEVSHEVAAAFEARLDELAALTHQTRDAIRRHFVAPYADALVQDITRRLISAIGEQCRVQTTPTPSLWRRLTQRRSFQATRSHGN